MNNINSIKLLDCTLRDGGYVNDWAFTKDFGFSLCRAVAESGCSYVEIGFYDPHTTNSSPWCHCSPDLVRELRSTLPAGTGVAVMVNFGSCDLGDFPPAEDYPVDLIRVATAKKTKREATELAAELGRRGYRTTVNYMAITEYSNKEILELVGLMEANREHVAFFYVADSFGSLLPKRAREIFSTLAFGTNAPLGFHPHNNLQLAFANSLEAIDTGFAIIDGSIYGMGRGAGNLFLEAALAYLEKQCPRFRLLPVLQFADLFVDALRDKLSWGYSLPQLISGVLSCHPNYPTNLLAEKLYTADEIYHMLQGIDAGTRSRFAPEVMNNLKKQYELKEISNTQHFLSPSFQALVGRAPAILLVAGGASVRDNADAIRTFAKENDTLVVSINRPDAPIGCDVVFFANRRRLLQYYSRIDKKQPVVFSQSIHIGAEAQFGLPNVSRLNVARIFSEGGSPFRTIVPTNSTVEAILAFASCGIKSIYLAGLDGFGGGGERNYYDETYEATLSLQEADKRNHALAVELEITRDLLAATGASFKIITPTLFRSYE